MQNSRYIQCDDSYNIKMYSNAIFINELNNCKRLYFLFYIMLDTITVTVFGGIKSPYGIRVRMFRLWLVTINMRSLF